MALPAQSPKSIRRGKASTAILIYYYFNKRRKDGTWFEIHEQLRSQVRQKSGRHKHPTVSCLDSQSVKMTSAPGECGYDKAKQVSGRKRHLLVDTLGLLLWVVESAGARLVLNRMPGVLLAEN